MVALGLVAFAEPLIASVPSESIIGCLLVVSGIVGLATVFTRGQIPGFWWGLVTAVLAIAIGAYLILRPFAGIVSLTLVVAAFLGAQGIAQLLLAIGRRAVLTSWVWILLSSLINLGLVGAILSGAPDTPWMLRLLFGINLLMGGVALAMTALASRQGS
jgi:uncharacterized membrane protein HdeD (DUF308 family)